MQLTTDAIVIITLGLSTIPPVSKHEESRQAPDIENAKITKRRHCSCSYGAKLCAIAECRPMQYLGSRPYKRFAANAETTKVKQYSDKITMYERSRRPKDYSVVGGR